MKARLIGWVGRHVIADDPNPQYSTLDRVDGLARRIAKERHDDGWPPARGHVYTGRPDDFTVTTGGWQPGAA